MYTIQGYEKVKSLEEAYELNQKKSSSIIGGGMWLRLGNRAIGKAIEMCIRDRCLIFQKMNMKNI